MCLKSSGISVLANSSSSRTMKESPFSDHLIRSVFLDSSRKLGVNLVSTASLYGAEMDLYRHAYLFSFCTNGGICLRLAWASLFAL